MIAASAVRVPRTKGDDSVRWQGKYRSSSFPPHNSLEAIEIAAEVKQNHLSKATWTTIAEQPIALIDAWRCKASDALLLERFLRDVNTLQTRPRTALR
jgi:hypothetical protein